MVIIDRSPLYDADPPLQRFWAFRSIPEADIADPVFLISGSWNGHSENCRSVVLWLAPMSWSRDAARHRAWLAGRANFEYIRTILDVYNCLHMSPGWGFDVMTKALPIFTCNTTTWNHHWRGISTGYKIPFLYERAVDVPEAQKESANIGRLLNPLNPLALEAGEKSSSTKDSLPTIGNSSQPSLGLDFLVIRTSL